MNQPTPEEQAMQQQQQAQMAQQQAAMQQQAMMAQQGQPMPVDLDMQTGQQGITGWDGRTFDQAQQGQMV